MSKQDEVKIRALKVSQPIGDFYLGVMDWRDLIRVSSVDMRRIEGDLDRYVGIQRKLSADRVKEIGSFVNSIDATFPSSVVLSVPGGCAEFDRGELTLFAGEDEETGKAIPLEEVASILDGQHRVEGLVSYRGESFDVPVSIFVNADIADQAYIFATVNLAQTKVNRSLVYDLLDYATARSPQKTCHDVAVALDRHPESPLYELIKRLGTATPGRLRETLAQATVVSSLLPFISRQPEEDRYRMAKGKTIKFVPAAYTATPFRKLWIDECDTDIARILIEYFSAVRDRWPTAWQSRERGHILPRTNGFRGFMRFLKVSYLKFVPEPGSGDPVVSRSSYLKLFEKVQLDDGDFTTDYFEPGTSGETRLFNTLREMTGV